MFCAARSGVAALEPREKISDYPSHLDAGQFTLAADYMVHSFTNGKQMYFTPDFLVVEVAVFPAAKTGPEFEVTDSQFTLRINVKKTGKKTALPAQTAGQVAASLKYANWTQHSNLTLNGGIGDTGVTVGGTPRVNRFPGDPAEAQSRLPRAPKAPDTLHPGVEQAVEARAEDVAVENAFPSGAVRNATAGFLYFAFSGKAEKIRSVELLYRSSSGEHSLSLK